VKIPQARVRDTTGAAIPGYFNIWRWILPLLTPANARRKKGSPSRKRSEVGEHADFDAGWPVGTESRGVGRIRGAGEDARPTTCIRQGRDVRCIVSVGMLTEGWD